jgi:hypothetical protein
MKVNIDWSNKTISMPASGTTFTASDLYKFVYNQFRLEETRYKIDIDKFQSELKFLDIDKLFEELLEDL